MSKRKKSTATKQRPSALADQLNEFAERSGPQAVVSEALELAPQMAPQPDEPARITSYEESQDFLDSIFEGWEDLDVPKEEFFVDVAPDSLESEIGYSSLHRQMHAAFVRRVAFYKSPRGGSCTTEELGSVLSTRARARRTRSGSSRT